MTPASGGDWNVAAYERFSDLRLRPALDLLARVPLLADGRARGPVVDLGCGAGAAGPALAARFPDRPLIGVDASETMLETARTGGAYQRLDRADIAAWTPETPPSLIFSNAALHWLDAHEALIPRLLSQLAPGGALAVQMPDMLEAPSHKGLIAAARAVAPERFAAWSPFPGARPAEVYAALLSPRVKALDIWTTTYLQRLEAQGAAHPVRAFSSSTAARPVRTRLAVEEEAAFAEAWDRALDAAYPRDAKGGVWFPFRRLFLVATV